VLQVIWYLTNKAATMDLKVDEESPWGGQSFFLDLGPTTKTYVDVPTRSHSSHNLPQSSEAEAFGGTGKSIKTSQ
jgi:hypothetical protein